MLPYLMYSMYVVFYVNKNLNSICLSYKVIMSLLNTWIKMLDLYELLLQCHYELFGA